jgi:hypothetical protein
MTDERKNKRLAIIRQINNDIDNKCVINENDAIDLISAIIHNKISKNFPKYSNDDGINSSISKAINSLYFSLTSENRFKKIIKTIKNYTPNVYTGKGEILLSFLFDDVKVVSKNEKYDISSATGKYEVKCYSDSIFGTKTGGIRLGVEANLNNFLTYIQIKSILNEIQNILHAKKEILHILNSNIIINGICFIDKLNVICNYSPVKNKKYNLFTGFEHGEISISLIKRLNDLFVYLYKVLKLYEHNINSRKTGKFSIGLNKYLLENPKDNDAGIITYTKKISVNDLNEVPFTYHIKNLMKLLKDYDIKNLHLKWINEMSSSLSLSFLKHPMIIINDDDNINSDICLGVYTDFDIVSISQGAAKIKPKIKMTEK